jgi:hypothetical protein
MKLVLGFVQHSIWRDGQIKHIMKRHFSGASNMPLRELLPTINQLSHKDKLRLIHILLLAVAREDGCNLGLDDDEAAKADLLNQLASTEAVVWSPQADAASVQALSDLLATAKAKADA